MGLHKLSAGDGYTYLTRQVAAADDTHRGRGSLGEYYEQKGESPGVWLGSGLDSLHGSMPEFLVVGIVTETQMTALFGEGRHPNADVIERRLQREGIPGRTLDRATKLGHAYHLYGPSEFQSALATRHREFNTAQGQRPNAAIPAAERARIRTELARERFRAEHGRDPLDARELTGYLTRVSRPGPVPVAGYDLTFSPVKSVSALWAIAPRELAETIAACHHEAVRDTIAWLEKHAAYTRRGTNGLAQVDTTGLIAAAFTHRDSRAGDPDLHAHVAVSNKVCTPDGRWLSLDGRALYRNKVAASEHYNARLEALLIERTGVRFAERGDAVDGKREIREVAGVPRVLLRAWSSRRSDIEAELAVLARRFQVEHGRPPSEVEQLDLAQQATLSTRGAKHEPRSEAEQRHAWRAEAAAVLGGADRVAALVRPITGHAPAPTAACVEVARLAETVIATVQASRATWQEHHVRAEAERVCRRLAAVPDFLVDQVAELTTGTAVPDWVDAIGPGSLLILDEAGMAGTLDLAALVTLAGERGASVRLVGDDRQLAAVGAGGVLRDVERTHGAVTLDKVRRFSHADGRPNRAEAAASLALRRGDPTGLGHYLDHGRIHVGDATTTADQALAAWATDRTAGLDALLIGSTNAQVRDLNLRAQAARLAAAAVPAERRVTLADGTTASTGDVIITRRNDRRLALSATDFVANGDRWTVDSVRVDGGLEVRHSRSHRRVTLPADYVAEHVQLGYASTVHGAQGQTVDTSHTVLTGTESRQLLYVALTRGRRENHLYLNVTVPGEDGVLYAEAQRPSTAVEMLTSVIAKDDSAVSATTFRRQERDPVPLLGKACAEYLDAIGVAGESILGRDGIVAIATRAEEIFPGISDWPAWPALHAQLQRAALNGAEPAQVLREEKVLVRRDHRGDLAAILAHWIEIRDHRTGPLPWLPPVPHRLLEDDAWGRYFDRRAELIQRHGAVIRANATVWTEQTAPAWAVPTLHEPDLTRDLAIWRAAHEVPDTDLRPTGPPMPGVRNGHQQHRLERRVSDAGAMPAKSVARIAQLGEALHPGITTDPHWPTLAKQLFIADREGLDKAQLGRIATARPLPIDQPAAALAYRLVDDIGDRTPTTTTRAVAATATARSTAPKVAPPEPALRRSPAPTMRRPYERLLRFEPPPDYARTFGSQQRHGPRR